MVWQKNHDNHDLDERLHRLREDPFDLAPCWERVALDYLLALEAKLLRNSMILYSSRQLTDGWIDPAVLPMVAANAQVAPQRVPAAIARLEKQGLLKKRTKRQGGGWDIRNFLKYNPTKDQVERRRAAERRLSWLQDSKPGNKVRDFIKARDGNRCRYCYIEMTSGDQRSTMRMTYDHARPHDPEFARDPRWIVQACAFHNGMKQDRTPEEAGLVLLPPWSEADALVRMQAKQLQDASLIVAAMLAGEDEQNPDEIVAALRKVLEEMQAEREAVTSARRGNDSPPTQPAPAPSEHTRSSTTSASADQKATEPPSNGHRIAASGRDGSGRAGTGSAVPVVPEDVPPPWSDEEIESAGLYPSSGGVS